MLCENIRGIIFTETNAKQLNIINAYDSICK